MLELAKATPWFLSLIHILLIEISRIMAGNEVGLADIIGGFNGGMTKTQMGSGQTAGLLGIVIKVALGIHCLLYTSAL